MNATYYHNVTPRGSLSSGFRAAQEQNRRQRISKGAGVLVSSGPRGTFIRTLPQRNTNNDSGSVIPRWG